MNSLECEALISPLSYAWELSRELMKHRSFAKHLKTRPKFTLHTWRMEQDVVKHLKDEVDLKTEPK